MLDSRAPSGSRSTYEEREAQAEKKIEDEAGRLMAETRLWRLANSAMWVAWGIVQAHIPGLPAFESETEEDKSKAAAELDSATEEISAVADASAKGDEGDHPEAQGEEEEEFDYLGYAQDRAMFFWGDAIRLGMIKAEELPEEVRKRVKTVEY
jgi:choline kinase